MEMLKVFGRGCLVGAFIWMAGMTYVNYVSLVRIQETVELQNKALLGNSAILYHIGTYAVAIFHKTEDHSGFPMGECKKCNEALKQRLKLMEQAVK